MNKALALRMAAANLKAKKIRIVVEKENRSRRYTMPIEFVPSTGRYQYEDGSELLPDDPRRGFLHGRLFLHRR